MSEIRRRVVVGVDSSSQALVAARYAVKQASVRGLDLLLVHAYPLPPLEAGLAGDVFTCCREAAEAVVADIVVKLDIPESVRVTTLVGQTAPVLLLEQAAQSARLVVVGQDHVGFFERLLVGSVAAPFCKQAPCPVVVVPRAWQPGPENHAPVVVALAHGLAGSEALDLGFEEAALSKTNVVALRAVRHAEPDVEVGMEEQGFAELMARYVGVYPDVSVQVRSVVGDPDRVIIESSKSASLLVVSSPRATGRGSWMRSVARRVLNQTQCPIAVIPRPRVGDAGVGSAARGVSADRSETTIIHRSRGVRGQKR